jgi:predicted enzyme related to lactoylglutathione lyase
MATKKKTLKNTAPRRRPRTRKPVLGGLVQVSRPEVSPSDGGPVRYQPMRVSLEEVEKQDRRRTKRGPAAPMILRTMHVIAVPDLAASGAFYRDVLGFTVEDAGDPGWRFFVKDACRIMAGECRDAMPARDLGDHSYFAYLVVDDVDACHARAVASRAEILKPPRDEPWRMRELGLRIMIGQSLDSGRSVRS